MKLSIDVENRKIEFDVEYRKRKTMSIQIKREGMVLVIAPKGLSKETIKEVVKSKGKWICKKLDEFKEIGYKPENRSFVDGELFMYLGEKYPLKIELHDGGIKRPDVMFFQDAIYIRTSKDDAELLKKAMEKWYRERCLATITERVEYYKHLVGKEPNKIRVKEQKKRWGSCTSRGDLLFNWRCIMAPLDIIDYIVVHEMCHLIHMNHSKEYWKTVEAVIPDYKERREWLKKYGVFLDI
ncbi:SprT family zinc-dependent metalloprotease [Wukongibacter baidiensis]|uniref:M48 family metallopeptidase n=1 Tax=Wukongibacter baidiensis TaxID=1723361 RepID=UPI003D7FF033